jgi:hypothetical protein
MLNQLLKDISDYKNTSDWLPIIASVCLLEVYIIYRAMSYKKTGVLMYRWYSDFGYTAIIADIFIMLIGFILIRYVYKTFIYPKYNFNPLIFIIVLLIIQIIHDLCYYYLIVLQIPSGRNRLIDYMKEYGKEYKISAIRGDSIMFILTSLSAMILKGYPPHVSITILIISIYMYPYVLSLRQTN